MKVAEDSQAIEKKYNDVNNEPNAIIVKYIGSECHFKWYSTSQI